MSSDVLSSYLLHSPKTAQDLVCDGRLIAQSLTNVLKNASESIFSHKGGENQPQNWTGKIEVFIRLKENTLEISVEDNGGGLPKELEKNIMDPYVTTREKGTGLGVAIVRKIMEEHGGSLVLEDISEAEGVRAILHFNLNNLSKLTI